MGSDSHQFGCWFSSWCSRCRRCLETCEYHHHLVSTAYSEESHRLPRGRTISYRTISDRVSRTTSRDSWYILASGISTTFRRCLEIKIAHTSTQPFDMHLDSVTLNNSSVSSTLSSSIDHIIVIIHNNNNDNGNSHKDVKTRASQTQETTACTEHRQRRRAHVS